MNPVIITLLLSVSLGPSFKPAGWQQAEPVGHPGLLVLRGHIICFDGAGKRLDSLLGCNGPGVRYALPDKDGKVYYFSATDASAMMFSDLRVRQRELQVAAKVNEKNQLEVVRVQSIHEGKLYDLYYFCELCNIKAYTPGLCPCCRNEMEFRETPATVQ